MRPTNKRTVAWYKGLAFVGDYKKAPDEVTRKAAEFVDSRLPALAADGGRHLRILLGLRGVTKGFSIRRAQLGAIAYFSVKYPEEEVQDSVAWLASNELAWSDKRLPDIWFVTGIGLCVRRVAYFRLTNEIGVHPFLQQWMNEDDTPNVTLEEQVTAKSFCDPRSEVYPFQI